MSRFHLRPRTREIYARGWLLQFLPLFSRRRSRVSRETMEACANNKGRRRNDTVPRSTGRVIFTGRKWSNSGRVTSPPHLPDPIPFLPFSCALYPAVARWEIQSQHIFLAPDKPIRRHHRRVSTVRFFDSKSKLHCLFTETFRSFSIVFILAAKLPLFHDLVQISFHVEDHRETYLKFYPSSPIWFASVTFNLPSFVWVSNVFHQDELDHNFQSKLNEDVESSPAEGQRFHSPFTRRLDRSLNYRGSGGSRYDRSTTEPRRITARRPFTLNRKQPS